MNKLLAAGALIFAPLTAAASCGSAFCTINTSWDAHGAWLEPGARLDLRYEYIRQDQPRSGTRDVNVGEIPRHHDEVLTVNRNLLGTFDYTFNENWGVSVLVPLVDREHDHIHNHMGEQIPEHWDFRELGDVRVMARRRLFTSENTDSHAIGTAGLYFGLKLPTGKTDVTNADGDTAERTLQPGTGTTDTVIGGYYSRQLPLRSLSWFVQGLMQFPLNEHDDYRPGVRTNVDLGVRYEAGERLGLLLQLNGLYKTRDRGAQAEPDDTGGQFLYVSPGVSYNFGQRLQAYAFVQLPLYQYVNGVQLVASHALAVGLNMRF